MAFEQRALAAKYSIPYGDLYASFLCSSLRCLISALISPRLHFAGAVGLTNCVGAPRLSFFAGRNKTSKPAPDGLVPAPFHSVDRILDRMKDAGFSPEEMVILLASHTIATQHTVDPSVDVSAVSLRVPTRSVHMDLTSGDTA